MIQDKSENLKEILICSVCHSLSKKPVSCGECEKTFCSVCIDSHISKNKNCPDCGKDFKKTNMKLLNQLIETISISCPSECGKIINYNQICDHLSKLCEKTIKSFTCIQCDSTLEAYGENDQRLRSHLESCNHSNLNCVFCDSLLKRQDLALHMETCSKKIMVCNLCTTTYPAETDLAHKSYYCDISKSYLKIKEMIEKL